MTSTKVEIDPERIKSQATQHSLKPVRKHMLLLAFTFIESGRRYHYKADFKRKRKVAGLHRLMYTLVALKVITIEHLKNILRLGNFGKFIKMEIYVLSGSPAISCMISNRCIHREVAEHLISPEHVKKLFPFIGYHATIIQNYYNM